ncbi:wound-responsive family protein [Rhynchospora pubera]|uniref:Wound-responsive family protein n=1 Tax=Rhynchospora pubera TaxID=906938 RepID=A0AAV8G650_9POAL|nr:wound-responsive family protein [Rhynchospora pubera]
MEEHKPQPSIAAAAVASTSSSAAASRVSAIAQSTVAGNPAGGRIQPVPVPGPSQASSSSNPRMEVQAVENGVRQRFTVELKLGETTIVSWKKLVKESGVEKSSKPESRAEMAVDITAPQPGTSAPVKQGENDPMEAIPPLNRFSSVIEKIERLYMGKNSSDEEEELDEAPDDDQYDTEDSFIDDAELDEYFQADNLVTKHTGYFVNKGQLEQISEATSAKGPTPKKRRRKDPTVTTRVHNEQEWKQLQLTNTAAAPGEQRPKPNNKSSQSSGAQKKSIDKVSGKETVLALESRNFGGPKGLVMESDNYPNSSAREKGVSGYIEMNPKKVSNGEKEVKIRKEKKGEFVEPSTSSSVYPVQPMYQMPTMVRDGTATRPKGSRLERAIKDLEKIVVECRPQSAEVQEVDPPNPAIKRRLPQDVKVKLAKVARLSAGQVNISEEQLIDRLMGILGHLVQRKTLKRNLREMVELGLCAKQEKADRYQHVKKEINEMVKLRVSQLKSKVEEQQANGSGDDFQEVGYSGALKGKFTMDHALEDKMCDLYDLYVEGMDEDKGPQCKKLYVELVELWPHGYMDNLGIKEAITRSKERKNTVFNHQKVRNEERLKKKKLAQQSLSPQSRPIQVQQNTSSLAIVPQEKSITTYNPNLSINPSSGGKSIVDPTALFPDYYQYQGSKKLKRKAESEAGGSQINRKPVKSKEKLHKLNRHSGISDEANVVTDKKTSTNDNPESGGQLSLVLVGGVGLPGSSDQANVPPSDNFPQ